MKDLYPFTVRAQRGYHDGSWFQPELARSIACRIHKTWKRGTYYSYVDVKVLSANKIQLDFTYKEYGFTPDKTFCLVFERKDLSTEEKKILKGLIQAQKLGLAKDLYLELQAEAQETNIKQLAKQLYG